MAGHQPHSFHESPVTSHGPRLVSLVLLCFPPIARRRRGGLGRVLLRPAFGLLCGRAWLGGLAHQRDPTRFAGNRLSPGLATGRGGPPTGVCSPAAAPPATLRAGVESCPRRNPPSGS